MIHYLHDVLLYIFDYLIVYYVIVYYIIKFLDKNKNI